MNPYKVGYFESPIKLLNDLTIEYWKWNLHKDGEFNLRYKYGEDSVFICKEGKNYYMVLSKSFIGPEPKFIHAKFRSTIGLTFKIIKTLSEVKNDN